MWLFKKLTPPTQAAKAHPIAKKDRVDPKESKSSASRAAASLLDDGGPSAETLQEDMFLFSNTKFKDLWDVCTSFDSEEQPGVEAKKSTTVKMKGAGDSGPPASRFKFYRWAPSTPISGMMQTIGLVPVPKEGLVGTSALPVSRSLPGRVFGLTIISRNDGSHARPPCYFRSTFLCQLNPLMLPMLEVHENYATPSDEEWKLRDLLAQRTEKLKVLFLFVDEFEIKENVLSFLKRLEDLLSDVTTVVLGNAPSPKSVYVIDLTYSENLLSTIAMLLESFEYSHCDEESFVKTMSACTTEDESCEFDSSLHEFVSAYPKSPNIHLSSSFGPSLNREMKNELSTFYLASGALINLSEFPNLQSLDCDGHFVSSPLQRFHDLRHLRWMPCKLTWFEECAWKCLSNLQCLSIHGSYLPPRSRISLRYFPKLVSLCLQEIPESIVVDYEDLPLMLNSLQLSHFQGSLEGSDQLRIERLHFGNSVCSDAYLQLCAKSKGVEVEVSDGNKACRPLSLVADQLKRLKVTLQRYGAVEGPLLPFGSLCRVFSLLESLELVSCSVMLSAATFPRLHHLLLDRCDVMFPKSGIVDQYGDTFPELVCLAMTNCKLLLDSPVPEDEVKDPVGVIHLQANSLFSLKLIDVSHLKMLQIEKKSFPRLQSLQCHVDNGDDFPFPVDEPGVPYFPQLRKLSLKKNALDGKKINLDLLVDMDQLENLELLDNAFFTLNDITPMQCSWVHFSSAVVKHENLRRFPGLMPIPMESLAEMVTFAVSLVGEQCEKLIIDRHFCFSRDRANIRKWCPPMFGFTETSINPAKIQRMVKKSDEIAARREGRKLLLPAKNSPVDQEEPDSVEDQLCRIA